MPFNANMKLIQTVTVGAGGAANIQFTSIPQTYTDLKILVSAKDNGSGDINNMNISFNGSTSNLLYRSLYTFGSTAASDTASNGFVGFTTQSGSGVTSNFNNMEIYIPNYTAARNKPINIDGVSEKNAATGVGLSIVANQWSNSAAITSVTLTPTTQSWVQYTTAYLYGVTSAGAAAKATGGDITSDGNYMYHTFTGSGTFTPTQSLTADYLVVAGGGGGGADYAGAGGAGGLRCTVGTTGGGGSLPLARSFNNGTAYTITVGAGGTGGTGSGRPSGASGSASSIAGSGFTTISTTGGGGGGGGDKSGLTGGSGGGSGGISGPRAGAAGTADEGYAGGEGNVATYPRSGGGGGAGAVGAPGSASTSGNGGIGILTTLSNYGVPTYYAGGGGAGGYVGYSITAGTGGSGGGGNGGFLDPGTGQTGFSGTANTGGGAGGGAGNNGAGGNGGSGIVVIRYEI